MNGLIRLILLCASYNLLLQFPYPDIPVADRFAYVAMRLQFNGRCPMFFIFRGADIFSHAFQFIIILYQYSILQNRYPCRRLQRSVIIKTRGCPDDIIGLPFTRFLTGIGQWNGLFINTGCLPVYISCIIITIEYL